MQEREQLRAIMIENAAEINRLHRRVHETAKRRSESEGLRREWSQACDEFHRQYSELWIPGGRNPGFYERILAGDPAAIEVALCFLEVRPYFFRSGYHWKTILQKCKRAPMSGEQAERFAKLVEKYAEWKSLRNISSKRGAAVRRDLWPLLRRLHNLFPVKLSDAKFDGLVTVGDLYDVLCEALKLGHHSPPTGLNGVVGQPCRAMSGAEMVSSVRAREYTAWRETAWTREDVWATLVATIVDAYQLGPSHSISPDTVLREPTAE